MLPPVNNTGRPLKLMRSIITEGTIRFGTHDDHLRLKIEDIAATSRKVGVAVPIASSDPTIVNSNPALRGATSRS